MRKTIITLFVLLATGSVWAGPREMFISRCGSCHQRGGATEPVNPGDKAAIVWEKYFKRKRHPTSLKELSEDEMQLIIQYLCDHAADSDKPESAAIPK